MYHSLLLHSPGETYLACFQFESIINRTIDTHMQLLCVCEHKVLWYQYKYLGIELLCHMISVCLTLQQISKMLSRVAETYCTLTKKIWGFPLLCIFTIAWYYQHFLKHSNSYGCFLMLVSLFYLNFWPHPVASEILVPWPRIKPTSLALEGRVLTMGPPGKSHHGN